jgi:kynureninase
VSANATQAVRAPTREQCSARDAADTLAPLREQFELPPGIIYLDGNSLGAMPRTASARVAQVVNQEWAQGLIRSWNDAGWIDLPARVGAKIGRLIGAADNEVVATDSTSVNLFKVLAAALRIQAKRRPERNLIVSERDNFPTDLYVAQGLADLLNGDAGSGYQMLLVDGAEELEAAIKRDPALVMLTQVNYRSGRIHDMAAVTARVRRAGALMVWDLAHSAGVLPVELNASGADFAVGCGYKYLNGGPGAPAYVWVAKRHQDSFWQPLSGWLGHAQPFNFESGYRPAPGISRYLCGTPPIVSLAALECGVDSVLAAETYGGTFALHAKSRALTDLFIELVESSHTASDLTLASPREATQRGSQVSFAAGGALGNGYALMQALIARGVIGDFRAPDVLRFGFAPLYTRFVDVYDACEILHEILATRSWDTPAFHQKGAVT